MKQDTKGITVKKFEDMTEWYGQLVVKSELADYAPIRGCMIIRPRGYSLWQSIQDFFNAKIKAKGVRNAYFPLFIPEAFFKKEAEHAKGFSPEVAWIANRSQGEERYAVRPTSETVIYDSYAKWIRSWRDLPMRINQWCNIVRWEVKDTKIFLRSREFLWQEGHCVYQTERECHKETLQYLELYRKVSEELLAIPVILGKKSDKERFPGALRTYTMEGFMPDGKSLQMGTSHDLGQGFAKTFGIQFLGKSGKWEIPWQNSWGFSTRLLGAMVLTHGDDKGIVIPPKMAENKVVIVPILVKDPSVNKKTLSKAKELEKNLRKYDVILDEREDYSAGWKFNQYELQGIPIRIEIGPKDVEKDQAVLVRRDTGDKHPASSDKISDETRRLLDAIQSNLFNKAKKFLDSSIMQVNTWEDFLDADKKEKLIFAAHCAGRKCEEEIKEETKGVTTRCIPFKNSNPEKNSKCIKCGKKASYMMYFSRAY